MDTGGIGISNLPNQRYKTDYKKPMDYNIMLVGGNGVGKTTFCNMLLGEKILSANPFLESEIPREVTNYVSGEAVEDFNLRDEWHRNSNINFQKTNISINEKGFRTNMSIIEVDCVGDQVNNSLSWSPIEKYILDQYKAYYDDDHRMLRSSIKDTRIHVCLYFLDPNSTNIKNLDIQIMRRISKFCNFIPIISKSDTLNPSQIQDIFINYQGKLKEAEIINNSFSGLQSLLNPPYFMICGDKNEANEYVRDYAWGSINVSRIPFNDFSKIRELILKSNFVDLLKLTEQFYISYKARMLITKYSSAMLINEQDENE